MDSTLPVAVQPSYKSRRGWLIAFGILEILIGGAFLLVLAFSAFLFLGHAGANLPPNPMSPHVLMVFVAVEYLALAAIFIAGGIGSIRSKNWARIYMLVVSGFWLVIGILTTLGMAFLVPAILRQQPRTVPPGNQHAILAVMIAVMTFLMVLLPTLFLFFYSRPSVKATCLAQKSTPTAPPVEGVSPPAALPIPLAILGAWQALGALSVIAVIFMRVAVLFGVVLRGAPAVLVLLGFSVLSGYTAWSIFHQRLLGWKIAMFMGGFWTASMLVTYLRHTDLLRIYREMGMEDQMLQLYERSPGFLTGIWVMMIVGISAFLAFLLYTRKYFPSEERA